MKKLTSFICVLTLFLCMVVVPASAEPSWGDKDDKNESWLKWGDGSSVEKVPLAGGTVYFADEGDHMLLYESQGLTGDVVIPETVNGKPVTELYLEAWKGGTHTCLNGNSGMTSLTLPASLKKFSDTENQGPIGYFGSGLKKLVFSGDGPEKIDLYAFIDCENLEELVLPKKVKDFSYAFEQRSCINLKKIVIDPSNPYYSMDDQGIIYNKDKTVLISAAQGAQDRTEVMIPDTVQEIKEHAFQYNTKLEKVSGGKNLVRGSFSPGECGEEFNPFLDTYGHWSEESAKWAFQTGTISGMTPVTFCPDKKLNRGMFVTMLNRAVRGGTVSGGLIFTDVPLTAYYRVPLKWAVACKVVTGVGGTRFAPEQNVTREQMAAMLYRYAQNAAKDRHWDYIDGNIYQYYYYYVDYKNDAKGDLTVFTDADKISSYAEEAMSWAVGTGILQGKNGGRLDPKGTATRAEAVTMVQRLLSIEVRTPTE